MNILELLKPSVKTALIQNGKHVSYAKLLESGLGFGGYLRHKGTAVGNHALIFTPLSTDLYIALIGAWSIGAIPIFIDFSHGAKFVNDSIERLKPDLIVCDQVTGLIRNSYPKMRRVKAVHIDKRKNTIVPVRLDEAHPAILSFTSGTTGIPKIAVRSHGFLIDQYHALVEHFNYNENHIDLGTLPVFTLANLASGMTTLLPDKSYKSRINSAKLAKTMEREKVSRVICSPALMANLLNYSSLPSLRNAYLGGGPVYPSLLDKIRKDIDLHIVYGSTEAEPISSIRWQDIGSADRDKITSGAGLPVGFIASGVECKIGEGEEVIVSGKTVLKGYLDGLGDDENKIRDGNKIWHRTGDAGYFDKQGRLWLLGRVNQAIHDKFGILHPFSLECVLDNQFGIRGAVLLKSGKRTVVIENGSADPASVLEALRPMHIEKVITVKTIPMDARHGTKIDYNHLEKIVLRKT